VDFRAALEVDHNSAKVIGGDDSMEEEKEEEDPLQTWVLYGLAIPPESRADRSDLSKWRL